MFRFVKSWRKHKSEKGPYPILRKVADQYSPTPASSIRRENLFSEADLVYEKKESDLVAIVQKNVCFNITTCHYKFELLIDRHIYSNINALCNK